MIEKIRGLSIKGRCFEEKTSFKFYEKAEDRIALVYGKNGSGKSTISAGFSMLTNNDEGAANELEASLFDEVNQPITVSENDKIFVFNEEYIDNNVKIDGDGLGTIILLGSQVDLQTQIEAATNARDNAKNEYDQAETNYNSYCQKSNPLCPDNHLEKIKNVLKKGWAAKDANIKGNKHNSAVNDKLVDEIGTLVVKETAAQIQEAITEKKNLLTRVSDNTNNYPIPVKLIPFQEGYEAHICSLLAKKIDNPELTEREKQILLVIENGHQRFIESAQSVFAKDETAYCPYCFQPVSSEYKKHLLSEIRTVLNKDVELHKSELGEICFPDFSQDNYSEFETLDTELFKKIKTNIEKCENIISQYNETIKQKLENIYTPLTINSYGLQESIKLLNTLLRDLEEKRQYFNDAAKKKKDLKNELIALNKKEAHLEIKPLYIGYKKQLQAKSAAKTIRDNKFTAFDSAKNKLAQLEQQKSNVSLAIKQINNSLRYIFFSDSRLSIELKDDKYYLKSNGNNVKPKDISLGERNIIALCYFFTQILTNQEVEKLYQTEELIIIDDPVSSFDFENKVGIISFLRYQINRIVRGNQSSKILLLSHDLETVFHLRKALDEITDSFKQEGKALVYRPWELQDRSLALLAIRHNEYVALLKQIYQYADDITNVSSDSIGNIMRRALEAFSTFNYRKPIEKVMYDSNVMRALGDKSLYFENLMCRLVLHGESHFKERIYSLQDNTNFFMFISDAEKQRTAREILCFMFILNKPHIIACLENNDYIQKIQSWNNAIPNNYSFEITTPEEKERIIKLYDLPLSAGTGNLLDESDSTEYTTYNPKADFALKISGNSMEPTIKNESIVLVQKCETIEDSEIGAFNLNGEAFCKRLQHINAITYLVSDNDTYSPIQIKADDELKLFGKVIEVVNNV